MSTEDEELSEKLLRLAQGVGLTTGRPWGYMQIIMVPGRYDVKFGSYGFAPEEHHVSEPTLADAVDSALRRLAKETIQP